MLSSFIVAIIAVLAGFGLAHFGRRRADMMRRWVGRPPSAPLLDSRALVQLEADAAAAAQDARREKLKTYPVGVQVEIDGFVMMRTEDEET